MKNNIRKYREAAGLSQPQLGKALGIGRSGMGKIEKKDVGDIPLEQLDLIAKDLHVAVSALIGGNEKIYIPKAPDNNFREVDVAILDMLKIIIDAIVSDYPITRNGLDEILANQETQYIKKGLKGAAPLIYALREHVNTSSLQEAAQKEKRP